MRQIMPHRSNIVRWGLSCKRFLSPLPRPASDGPSQDRGFRSGGVPYLERTHAKTVACVVNILFINREPRQEGMAVMRSLHAFGCGQ